MTVKTPADPLPADAARPTLDWRTLLVSAGLVGLATLAALPLRAYVNPTNLVMIYFVAVILAAVLLGLYAAVLVSLLSVLVFDLFFVPPYNTLAVDDVQYLITLAGLLVVGLVIGLLTERVREQQLSARRREAQTAALYEFHRKLAIDVGVLEIAQTAVQHVQATLDCEAAIYLTPDYAPAAEDVGSLRLAAASPGWQMAENCLTVVDWVYSHGQPSSCPSDKSTPAKNYCFPLQTSGQVVGVLSAEFKNEDGKLGTDQRRFLDAFATQVALALERAQLAEAARQARLLEETEKLQTALLNSISHDLRTPLATITGVLSSVLEDASLLSEADRTELVLTAWEEAVRLNRLVGNLLDMTRLQSGAMKLFCQTNDVEDLIGATLAQMPRRLRGRTVQSKIPYDLPPVEIDLALTVQVLVNLLDNALKYSPAAMPIEIEAYQEGAWVIVAVKDRGPGLPEGDSELLFNKFFRGLGPKTPEGVPVGGTGLGLSIAKGIVEAHGGRIWAANRPAGGAIFSFSLPVTQKETT